MFGIWLIIIIVALCLEEHWWHPSGTWETKVVLIVIVVLEWASNALEWLSIFILDLSGLLALGRSSFDQSFPLPRGFSGTFLLSCSNSVWSGALSLCHGRILTLLRFNFDRNIANRILAPPWRREGLSLSGLLVDIDVFPLVFANFHWPVLDHRGIWFDICFTINMALVCGSLRMWFFVLYSLLHHVASSWLCFIFTISATLLTSGLFLLRLAPQFSSLRAVQISIILTWTLLLAASATLLMLLGGFFDALLTCVTPLGGGFCAVYGFDLTLLKVGILVRGLRTTFCLLLDLFGI